jgi:hypothetical protein
MVNKILVKKYERYFWDPNLGDEPLRPTVSSVACVNIRHALDILKYDVPKGYNNQEMYDEELRRIVRLFQRDQSHSAVDGYVGPRTRRLLTKALLINSGPPVFKRFKDPIGKEDRPKTVFLSYAHADKDRINKLDQWLHDNGVKVIRDIHHFRPGLTVEENIEDAIAIADKVVGVFSKNSQRSDWTRRELSLVRQCEEDGSGPMLIYLLLDDIEVPSDDQSRVSIYAKEKALREVGKELIRGITGNTSATHYIYDENEPL